MLILNRNLEFEVGCFLLQGLWWQILIFEQFHILILKRDLDCDVGWKCCSKGSGDKLWFFSKLLFWCLIEIWNSRSAGNFALRALVIFSIFQQVHILILNRDLEVDVGWKICSKGSGEKLWFFSTLIFWYLIDIWNSRSAGNFAPRALWWKI